MSDKTEKLEPWYTKKGMKQMLGWWKRNLKIKSKKQSEGLVSFVPNFIQRRLLGYMAQQRRSGFPVRIIILKARQEGCSSLVAALYYYMVFCNANTNAFVCAHVADSSIALFDKVTLFHDTNPLSRKEDMKGSSRRELIWKHPHNSKFQVQTAGSKQLKSGDTFHYLHLSELAKWEDDVTPLMSVMQTLAGDKDSICVIEATAYGEGGSYHERWLKAVERQLQVPGDLNGFFPVFFSWLDHPEYQTPVPKGYEGPPLDEEERWLQTRFGATREQLFWRRNKIRDDCGDDIDLFHQDFPSTPGEAFLASGRPGIPKNIIVKHRKDVAKRKPQYGLLHWDNEQKTKARFEDGEYKPDQEGVWRIYAGPKEGRDYAIGGDVAEGKVADPNDPRSDTDRSAAVVLDRQSRAVVAVYFGRPHPHEFKNEMEKASSLYNNAPMAPEVNSIGYSVLEGLLADGYAGRLYQRSGRIEDVEPHDPSKFGWKTTTETRPWLYSQWIQACFGTPDRGYEDAIICYSKELVDEEATTIIDEKGKKVHKSGCHDDILFAAMLAWECHKRWPRETYAPHGSFKTADPSTINGLLYEGGIDTELEQLENGREPEILTTV